MPHKDRETRLAYLRAWKERHRPSPQVETRSGDLPPYGRMVYSADGHAVQCHVCGGWYGRLAGHLKMHGLNAGSYKETYGLRRGASTDAPARQSSNRAAALDRDQGSAGRPFQPGSAGREPGTAARLEQRIGASIARKGLHTRGGAKTRRTEPV